MILATAPMVRGLGPVLGDVLARLHRDHGVDLRTGIGVAGFDGADRVQRVRLDDGSTIDADMVVIGVGVEPATDWLEGSGLTIDNGVVCDERCRVVGTGGAVVAAGVAAQAASASATADTAASRIRRTGRMRSVLTVSSKFSRAGFMARNECCEERCLQQRMLDVNVLTEIASRRR